MSVRYGQDGINDYLLGSGPDRRGIGFLTHQETKGTEYDRLS